MLKAFNLAFYFKIIIYKAVMAFNINHLLRPNIEKIVNQKNNISKNEIKISLHKNENSLGSPLKKWYNRYPDDEQNNLKQAISALKNVTTENVFLANGTNESIEILYKCFCAPEKDNVIICPPTYSQFENFADIYNIEVRKAVLLENFQLDLITLENLVDTHTKIIWLCSPNNPTGNSLNLNDIEFVLNNFNGLVVVDEAYINFSAQKSLTALLKEYDNLIILQTFSIAWGLAGLRLAIALSNPNTITILNKVRNTNTISTVSKETALKAFEEIGQVNDMIKLLVEMRIALADVFKQIPFIIKVHDSDANFILIEVDNASKLTDYLLSVQIAVKNVSHLPNCHNCIRITVGNEKENTDLVDALSNYLEMHY